MHRVLFAICWYSDAPRHSIGQVNATLSKNVTLYYHLISTKKACDLGKFVRESEKRQIRLVLQTPFLIGFENRTKNFRCNPQALIFLGYHLQILHL